MNISTINSFLSPADVSGRRVNIHSTHPSHIQNQAAQQNPEQPSFANMLLDSVNQVNDRLNYANDISIQAITNPDSVEAHDVTIALAQANLSLNITQNVVTRVVQAYRELTTLR